MPFLKTPKQMEKPRIEDNNFTTYLFYTGKAKGQLKKEGLQKTLNYVKYGEHKQIKVRRGSMKGKKVEGVIELASFQKKFERSPDSWYCLQNNRLEMEKGEKGILIQKIFNSNYKLGFFSDALMPNNTFYFIRIRKKFSEDSEIILALLMSSLTMLCIELEGRTNFGGGALDTATFDIKNIILPRPSIFETQEKNKLKKAAQRLYSTKFGDLEKEIGKEARKDIDSLIFAKINGQKKWNNEEFYGALKNIQKSRTEKRKFR